RGQRHFGAARENVSTSSLQPYLIARPFHHRRHRSTFFRDSPLQVGNRVWIVDRQAEVAKEVAPDGCRDWGIHRLAIDADREPWMMACADAQLVQGAKRGRVSA